MTAIHFKHEKCDGKLGAQIPVLKDGQSLDSFSACLRFMIKHWWTTINLIGSPSFSIGIRYISYPQLYFYPHGYPSIFYNSSFALSLSTLTWNSLCFSYDSTVKQIKLFLNGLEVTDITEGSFQSAERFNMSYIEIGEYSFIEGYFTDVYVWNGTLKDDQILKYSLGNVSALLLAPNATILRWKAAKINIYSSCIELADIATQNISIHNAFISRKYYLVAESGNLEKVQKFCYMKNGHLLYPKDFESLKSVFRDNGRISRMECSHSMWTPFQKDIIDSKEWHYGKRWEKQKRGAFNPWTLNDKSDGLCLYLNFSTGTLHSSDCKKTLCAVCELDNERLAYHLYLEDFSKDIRPESNYILTEDQKGDLFYTGVTGNWEIRLNGSFVQSKYMDDQKVAAHLDFSYLAGVNGLRSGNYSSIIKFINVRHLIH